MAKIFFINPKDNFLEKAGDRPPLSLAYLSSFLQQYGCETKIIDLNHENMDTHLNETPDYICFTISTPNYKQVIDYVKKLKIIYKTTKFIAGGNHINAFPNEKLTLETFDYIVTGIDGEEGIKRIIDGNVEEQIVIGKEIENLDSLPFPDYSGLKLERYNMKVNGKKGMMIIASRGCIFSCCFCGQANMKKIRKHTPEYVVANMIYLYEIYDIRGFYFGDDCFTYNFEWVEKWCRLVRRNFKDITIRITTRADLLTQEMCYNLKLAGVDIISLGLESGSDKVLRAINKGITLEQQKKGIEYCYKANIKVKGFFIMGLPSQTFEDGLQTIQFAKDLVKNGRLHYADCYILTPSPASPLWLNPSKYDMEIIKPKDDDWNGFHQTGGNVNIKHPYLSEEQLKELIKRFHKEVNIVGLTYN